MCILIEFRSLGHSTSTADKKSSMSSISTRLTWDVTVVNTLADSYLYTPLSSLLAALPKSLQLGSYLSIHNFLLSILFSRLL